ncbi:MAG: radical SAM protein [Planctomycetes bacterium]|nr:radical SAM protein [Planctomycetota bacterium]
MIEVAIRQRKSPVLTPSSLPCLRQVATLNVTEGCALGCKYCYIQGYSHYPGAARVVLYESLPGLVAAELQRKRRKPRRVYFSPSSDAFQYLPQVQDVSRRTMQVLLEAGVEVAFLTKGFVRRPFLELFVDHADAVFAKIGITTLDRKLWRAMEPGTAPPEMRVATIAALRKMGVHATARLDPLIADVTGADENVVPLLRALAQADIREAAASYIFTRTPFERQVVATLARLERGAHPPASWAMQTFAEGAGRGRMIGLDQRSRRFARLQALGTSAGVRIRPCRCKNPESADEPCAITGPADRTAQGIRNQGELSFVAPHVPARVST